MSCSCARRATRAQVLVSGVAAYVAGTEATVVLDLNPHVPNGSGPWRLVSLRQWSVEGPHGLSGVTVVAGPSGSKGQRVVDEVHLPPCPMPVEIMADLPDDWAGKLSIIATSTQTLGWVWLAAFEELAEGCGCG